MRAQARQLMDRVDAMTLRERGLLFLCVLVVLGALTWVLAVMPLAAVQKQRAAQIDQVSAQMEALRDQTQVGILEGRRQRAAQLNADIARLQAQIEAIEGEGAEPPEKGGEVASTAAVLRRVVRRTEKVALVRVATSAAEPRGAPPAGTAGVAGGGLDITLAGRYLDLMEYLATLEAAMPRAHWSALRLTAETSPAQVVVRLATPPGQP